VLLNATPDASGDGIVNHRIVGEKCPIRVPVAIINGIAIPRKNFLNLQTVRNFLN